MAKIVEGKNHKSSRETEGNQSVSDTPQDRFRKIQSSLGAVFDTKMSSHLDNDADQKLRIYNEGRKSSGEK